MVAAGARRGVVGVVGLAVAALALAGMAPAEGAKSRARAAILFLPWAGGDRSLLRELAGRGLAVGLTSPTAGGYAPAQVLLDMGQGARVPLGSYGEGPPALGLQAPGSGAGGGRMVRWERAVTRARAAPGELVPGLLATAVRRAGRRVTYAGPRRERNAEAAVAAEESGRVERVALGDDREVAARAPALWRRSEVLVVRLPAGAAGLAGLDGVLRDRRPEDLVWVMRAPPGVAASPPLLAAGISGRGFGYGGSFVSATTRRPGLVAATDLGPTVLEAVRSPVTPEMQGQAIRPARTGRRAAVAALHERLTSIIPRRVAALAALLGGWFALLGVLAVVRGACGARAGLRLGLLTALWFPALALAGAAFAPASAALETFVLAGGSLAIAVITDRLLPWPAGPALPAAAVMLAYAGDLAVGSPLTAVAVTGPNPAAGARFYGIGNELEILLCLSLLLGAGAAGAAARARARAAAIAFAAAGALGALVLGPGRLGADVGAAITLGAGAAAAAAFALPLGRVRRAMVMLVVIAPLAGLLALAAVDLATGGGAHLSRSVVEAPGVAAVLDVVRRRIGTQLALLGSLGGALVAIAALALVIAGVRARASLLAPLVARGARPLAAGVVGGLVATFAGAVGNDSPTDMLAIGAVMLALAVAYARAAPPGATELQGAVGNRGEPPPPAGAGA